MSACFEAEGGRFEHRLGDVHILVHL